MSNYENNNDTLGKIKEIIDKKQKLDVEITADKIIKEYCIIENSQLLFGIQLEYLREVYDIRNKNDIIPIPFTPPFLIGVTNVRGEILPVVNIGKLLGVSDVVDYHKMVITEVEYKIAFPVTSIEDLIQIDISSIQPIYANVNEEGIRFVNGEFIWNEQKILIIDMLRLFSSSEFRVE